MSVVEFDPSDESTTPSPPAFRLHLNTLSNARKSLGRVLQAYHAGRIGGGEARTYAFLLQTLLAFMKEERDQEIERRLDRLEQIAAVTTRGPNAQS